MSSKVETFHRKQGFANGRRLEATVPRYNRLLRVMVRTLKLDESSLRARGEDPRCVRTSLMLGELAEVIEALVSCDREQLAKELADLLYVTIGTAVTYGIPIEECFDRIHAANMTKEGVTLNGNRGKGPSYVPPKVEDLL